MKLYVIRDGVFTLKNGHVGSNLLGYEDYAKRFVGSFDEVVLIGRLFEREDATAKIATGPGVTFLPLPGYHGPLGFIINLPWICRTMWRTLNHGDAYILRIPATIPSLYGVLLYLRGIPFAVEVAADPYDGYSKQALDGHLLASLFRFLFVQTTKWLCRKAKVAAYVTREALQLRYPPRDNAKSFSFTSIDLTAEAYVAQPRTLNDFNTQLPHMVLIGNMQKSLKGHDTLLQAMAQLNAEGFKTQLTVIGYGENQGMYETMAADLGLAEQVTFTGKLQTGAPIRAILDTADLFVLPSRQEGLPRAMLEAMARGLPAIGTRVGGTPELLMEDCLIEPNDALELAARIKIFANDADKLAELSKRNLKTAKLYNVNEISKVRKAFYEMVNKISKVGV